VSEWLGQGADEEILKVHVCTSFLSDKIHFVNPFFFIPVLLFSPLLEQLDDIAALFTYASSRRRFILC